jgi:hypothetical protein
MPSNVPKTMSTQQARKATRRLITRSLHTPNTSCPISRPTTRLHEAQDLESAVTSDSVSSVPVLMRSTYEVIAML